MPLTIVEVSMLALTRLYLRPIRKSDAYLFSFVGKYYRFLKKIT